METTPGAQVRVRLADGRVFGPAGLDTVRAWASEGRVPPDAAIESEDGAAPSVKAAEHPALRAAVAAPPTVRTAHEPVDHSGVSLLIPYRNAPALVGYYVSVASLIPVFALVAGPAAVILGVMGLRHRRRVPQARGAAHAWVAIVLGSLTTLGNAAVIIAMALSA